MNHIYSFIYILETFIIYFINGISLNGHNSLNINDYEDLNAPIDCLGP